MSLSEKATKAKKLKVKQSVLEWCKDQVSKGKELTLHWEGGGDSGWCYFKIDGKEATCEYAEYLTDMMYSELSYGSWAGEFSAQGDATFDVDEQAFVGIDTYSEDETQRKDCNIKIVVPQDLWFDSISIDINASDYDDPVEVNCSFNIKNGFKTKTHSSVETNLESVISEEVSDFLEVLSNADDWFYNGMNTGTTFFRNQGVLVNGNLEFTIDSLDVNVRISEDKSIYLQIDEDETLPNENE